MERISYTDCFTLKPGETIYIMCGYKYLKSIVKRPPFWNNDANIPEWEIETNNGYTDLYSVYRK